MDSPKRGTTRSKRPISRDETRSAAATASSDEQSVSHVPRAKAYSYIRMSTKEQLQGGSLKRQDQRTEQYVREKNLELVENYDDIGVSAFRGRNQQGTLGLGQFLAALRENVVTPGSYLIVESMDRLTRQTPMTAMAMFNEIIMRGVVVVTLDDGMEYSADGFAENQYKLFMALGSMMRAHAESARKSDLLSAAWRQKRELLVGEGAILTAAVPAWLRVDKTKNEILPIPERVAVIKEIFDLTCNGYGIYSIASLFNKRKETPWGVPRQSKVRCKEKKAPVWRDSYIKKILVNRAVLGEFQPHRTDITPDNKKLRTPVGDSIPDYFPQVVSREVFRDAHLAMERRRNGIRGRKGRTYANLFTGMIHCESCGSGMRYLDKGGRSKQSKYLKCSVAVSGGGCDPKSYRYEPVEKVILFNLESLDVQKILSGEAVSVRLREKKRQREAARNDLSMLERKVENLNNILAADGGAVPSSTLSLLRSLERDQEKVRSFIETLDAEIDEALLIDPTKRRAILDELMVAIRDPDEERRSRSRHALAGELQRMIASIVLRHDADTESRLINPDITHIYPASGRSGDFDFEATVHYRNGEQQVIRGLNIRMLMLKANRSLS
jgi:DNA invertase Pin-like site-specific DNA recombinase